MDLDFGWIFESGNVRASLIFAFFAQKQQQHRYILFTCASLEILKSKNIAKKEKGEVCSKLVNTENVHPGKLPLLQ